VISKVASSSRVTETFGKVDKTFRDFDGRIETLIQKGVELQSGIDSRAGNVIGKVKEHYDRISRLNDKINKAREAMHAMGIYDPKLERILDRAQEATHAGMNVTGGVVEAGEVLTEDLKKGIRRATAELQKARDELKKRGAEIQGARENLANMRPQASKVDKVADIVSKDPDYQGAREGFFDAFLTKQGASTEERSQALGERIKTLEERYANATDQKERDLIGYQISLINKRLDEYKKQQEEQKERERIEAIVCGANEEKNAQGVCVCISGYEPYGGKCLPICAADERRNEAGVCRCVATYERINGVCVPPCGTNKVRNKAGNCVCMEGYIPEGNGCTLEPEEDFGALFGDKEKRRGDELSERKGMDAYRDENVSRSGYTKDSMKDKMREQLDRMKDKERESHVRSGGSKVREGTAKPPKESNATVAQSSVSSVKSSSTSSKSSVASSKRSVSSSSKEVKTVSSSSKSVESDPRVYVILAHKWTYLERYGRCSSVTYTVSHGMKQSEVAAYLKKEQAAAKKKVGIKRYPLVKALSVSIFAQSEIKPSVPKGQVKCNPCPTGQHIGLDADKQYCH